MKRILLMAIVLYQKWLSPFFPTACRYYPTCSDYAHRAISLYGWHKGGYLALKRLMSCHPWSAGGYAPVPEPQADADESDMRLKADTGLRQTTRKP